MICQIYIIYTLPTFQLLLVTDSSTDVVDSRHGMVDGDGVAHNAVQALQIEVASGVSRSQFPADRQSPQPANQVTVLTAFVEERERDRVST